jgi:hypothetical protein
MPVTMRIIDASEHFTVGYVAPRASFDGLLCEHALQAGTHWLNQVTIHAIEEVQASTASIVGVYKNSP